MSGRKHLASSSRMRLGFFADALLSRRMLITQFFMSTRQRYSRRKNRSNIWASSFRSFLRNRPGSAGAEERVYRPSTAPQEPPVAPSRHRLRRATGWYVFIMIFEGANTSELLCKVVSNRCFIHPMTECIDGCNTHRDTVILRRTAQLFCPFSITGTDTDWRRIFQLAAIPGHIRRRFLWMPLPVLFDDFIDPFLFQSICLFFCIVTEFLLFWSFSGHVFPGVKLAVKIGFNLLRSLDSKP